MMKTDKTQVLYVCTYIDFIGNINSWNMIGDFVVDFFVCINILFRKYIFFRYEVAFAPSGVAE